MSYFRFLLLTLLLLTAAADAAKTPVAAWQTGTLTDTQESWHSKTVGTLNNGHGMLVGREYPIVHYTIDAPPYVYEADLVLKHRHDKQPTLTVNGPIKFAFVKSDLYIQDEQGKEIRLTLTKKTLTQGH